MRLRSGRDVSDPNDSSPVGDMSNAPEELLAEVQTLRNENARILEELAALKLVQAGQGSASSSRGRPSVQAAEALANVPVLAKLSDIVHQPSNPVQRSAQAPDSIALIDVECEPGYIRAKQAGAAVAREYAESNAPLLSYLYDAQQELEKQIRAADIPEDRRKSLAVIAAALRAVLDFLIERHDLLVAKGEYKHSPGLVQALELGLAGVEGVPIHSSRVMQELQKHAAARVAALTKQSAKQSGGPSRSNGGGSSSPSA